jgi:hypothetical protein
MTQQQSFDMESLRLHLLSTMAQLKSKVSMRTLRPLPVFLGIQATDEEDVYELSRDAYVTPSLPQNINSVDAFTKVKHRVRENLHFFATNYCMIAAMTALVVTLMHPMMILVVSLVYGLWVAHEYLIRHELVLFNTIPIQSVLSVQKRFYLFLIISSVAIVLVSLGPVLVFCTIAAVLILAHAALRDTRHLREASERSSFGKTTMAEETKSETDSLLRTTSLNADEKV